MAKDKRYPKKEKDDLEHGRVDIPPMSGTFTPPADYDTADAETERVLQIEQKAVAKLVDDAVRILGGAASLTTDAEFGRCADKLSQGARITARVLTKLRMDAKSSPRRR